MFITHACVSSQSQVWGLSDPSGHGLYSLCMNSKTHNDHCSDQPQVWLQSPVTNLHVHQILRHKTHNWHNGLFWSVVKKYSHCYWGPPTTTVYLKNISFQISRKLVSWIPETLFELCFECMCVLTIWMLRRFNLLCQVKFTSFRLRLAFLKDFIKIGISSELNSDSLSLSLLSPTQGVTCYMCRVTTMGWWQVRTFSGVTLYCGRDKIYWSVFPRAPLHLVTMWPRVMSPGIIIRVSSQPSTLCRLSNYL